MVRGIWEADGERACSVCGAQYWPTRKGQRVCSPKCRNRRVNRLVVPGDLDPRPCTKCGNIFTPSRRNSRLCGSSCPGRPVVMGNCVRCGKEFVTRPRGKDQIYCGATCRDSASKIRNGERFRRYGMKREEYDAKVEEQANRCAACGEEPKNSDRYGLVVDHDHRTGKRRGLLCNKCNMGIGLFDDDPEKLKMAIKYLMVHRPA